MDKFKNCISVLTFIDILNETDANKTLSDFHDTLILYFNLCFPKITVKITKKSNKSQWITKGIKKMLS